MAGDTWLPDYIEKMIQDVAPEMERDLTAPETVVIEAGESLKTWLRLTIAAYRAKYEGMKYPGTDPHSLNFETYLGEVFLNDFGFREDEGVQGAMKIAADNRETVMRPIRQPREEPPTFLDKLGGES